MSLFYVTDTVRLRSKLLGLYILLSFGYHLEQPLVRNTFNGRKYFVQGMREDLVENIEKKFNRNENSVG